jgi:hypothetical protein
MTVTIKKILVGSTIAASIAAFASTPAFATNLTKPTNIQFTTNGVNNTDGNKANINTWTYGSAESDNTGIAGVNRQVLNDYNNKGNINKAIAALTDNDSATNVELFTDGEVVKDHVGFTANFGRNTLKVESVTQADWADGTLATTWLKGFGNAYGGLMSSIPTTAGSNLLKDFNTNFGSLVTALSATGFNTAGDPNVGGIALSQIDQHTGELKLDLVGHLDVAGKYVDTRATILDTRPTIKDTQKTIVDTRATILDTVAKIKDTRATILDTRPTIKDTQKTIVDTRATILDTRPTIKDTQKTIVDTRATILDTRLTIKDTRGAKIVDTRETILDTAPKIVINGKLTTNPTYNQQIANPTYNQLITNPTNNKDIANPTYNQQIANPTYNKDIANPTYNKDIANPTYNQQIANLTYNQPIANPTYNKDIANPTYNKDIANPTYNQQIANPTYNKDIANPTYNQQIANPTYNKDIANPTFNKNIPNPTYLAKSSDFARNSTGNSIFDGILLNLVRTAVTTNTPFQISEIAKVTFNDKVDYAFGFSATDSGAIAGDRNKTNDKTSHTGIYSWSQTYKTVPEPSALFGIVTVGGLVIASRRKRMKNA